MNIVKKTKNASELVEFLGNLGIKPTDEASITVKDGIVSVRRKEQGLLELTEYLWM